MAQALEFELVIYDETENFRPYYDPLFDYPFETRKTKAATFTVDTKTTDSTGNYGYAARKLTFMLSQVCLEKSPFADLAIWNPIQEKAKEIISGKVD